MAHITELDDKLSIAGQIDVAEIGRLAADGYKAIINNRPDHEEPGQLDHEMAAAEAAKQKLAYHYQPVTMGTIGRKEVTDFYQGVMQGPHPVLAHCRSGTRCYLLWSAGRVLFEKASAPTLVAEAAAKGYDLRALPALVEKIGAGT